MGEAVESTSKLSAIRERFQKRKQRTERKRARHREILQRARATKRKGPKKRCNRCRETKALDRDHFYYCRANKDGYQNACIVCERAKPKAKVPGKFGRVCAACADIPYRRAQPACGTCGKAYREET